MLTDAALKHLKPKEKNYKVADRDGMYVLVRPSGTLSFQLDYRMNGRRETVTFGKYGPVGLSLARARELCIDAKRAIAEGRSPAIEKQREKRRLLEAKSFGEFGEKWLTAAPMADSTRAMRRSIFERELLSVWRNRLLTEITPDDLRAHCGAIVERGAPATAIHVRDIVKQIYGFAILHGEKVANPADDVGPASIATFVPKNRSLSPTEIRIMLKQLEKVATLPTIRLGMRLYLQTMVRKSELQDATWGRGRFRERRVDDSEGADEALESAQRLHVSSGARHLHRAKDLRGQLQIRFAVALRRRRTDVSRHLQSRHLPCGGPGEEGRASA
jgi:integrase